jgi:trimeric autotransporter adhesin
MKLQTGTYDAEMGRTGVVVFNAFLRSGTNEVHGSVLGYTRQTDWLANNFFYNRSGTPRPDTPFYMWGGSFGAPVILPKIYNGKNKTFF